MPHRMWCRQVLVSFLAACALLLNSVPPIFALETAMAGQFPVPDKYKVTASFDKEKYFLGENVLLHFCVENTGAQPFSVDAGGDYRGAARHLRFKVTAVDASGKAARDPHPASYCMGGLSSSPSLKPGEKFYASLPLMRYCAIDAPGTYTVTVSHDLGWKLAGKKPPIASTTITFVAPSPAEAQAVVDRTAKLPADGNSVFGKRTDDYEDFSTLAYPVYFPILMKRLKTTATTTAEDEANKHTLEGIGAIATSEATHALLDLAGGSNPKLALEAAGYLNLRLPDPQLTGKLGPRNVFEDPQKSERQWLVKHAWRPEFVPAVRKLARAYLKSSDKQHIVMGAFMLECVGTADDITPLTAALDKAIEQTKGMKLEEGIYPRPRGAVAELMRAAEVLSKQQHAPPTTNPKTPGEAVLFLTAIGADRKFRPSGWQSVYARLLKHELPYVREVALNNLPSPTPAEFRKQVADLLLDPEVDTQIAACHVAEKEVDSTFKGPLLKALQQGKEEWLLRTALNAAAKQAVYSQALIILAERLDEPGMTQHSFDLLLGIFTGAQGWGSNKVPDAADGARMKPLWLAFLKQHAKQIDAGQQIKIGDPALSKEMFPATFQFNLSGGKKWP